MEGVLTPEIWIAVAEKTKIPELRRTTRDEPDYDKLMNYRIGILDQHGIKLSDIQKVIGTLPLLEGTKEFLDELRSLALGRTHGFGAYPICVITFCPSAPRT